MPMPLRASAHNAGARSLRALARWPLLWPVVPTSMLAHSLESLPSIPLLGAIGLLGSVLLLRAIPLLRMFGIALLTFAFCLWRAHGMLGQRLEPGLEGRALQIVGHVEAMPRDGMFGPLLRMRIESCVPVRPDQAAPECAADRSIQLRWTQARSASAGRDVAPPVGSRWRLEVRLKRPHSVLNPGGFDGELAALADGLSARGHVTNARARPPRRLRPDADGPMITLERWRDHARHWMRGALHRVRPDVGGTLIALVVGDQGAIAPATWRIYQRTGVGHLMSISGLHITMLAGMILWASRRIGRHLVGRVPGIGSRFALQHLVWWPALALALAYSLFSGWGVPAQRTCWMLAAAAFVIATGRAGGLAHVLAIAAAVVVVADPWAPLSASFWLSFAAVGAIVLHGHGAWASRRAWWRDALATQWAATVAMLPLGAVFFASFSLISPIANAFAIPAVSILIAPLALGATALATLIPAAGAALLVLVAWPARWLIDALIVLSESAGAVAGIARPQAWVLAGAALGAWSLLAPSRPFARLHALALFVPMLSGGPDPPAPGHWRMTLIDIGQGNSVLVETHAHRLLYDTGPSYGPGNDAGARHIVPALRARGITHLDRLVISHEDSDHAGGAASVLDSIRVDQVFGSLRAGHPINARGPVLPCRRGVAWQWDGIAFEWLHPGPERLAARVRGASRRQFGGNDSSCVLRIRSAAGSALLAGDIERRAEADLVAIYGDAGLKSDVLLAPHHGSGTSSSAAFIAAVAPTDVLIQIGYRNRFHHPKPVVVARYRHAGARVWRSDAQAAIDVEFSPGRAPRLQGWRTRDARYWRIRVDTPAP